MPESLDERVKKMMKGQKFVTIVRIDDFCDIEGYIVAAARRLVLIHVLERGIIAGYCVVRSRDIVKVQHGAHERFHEHMYLSNGLAEQIQRPKKVVLGSWASFFTWLVTHHQFATVEGEEEAIDGFVQGKIRNVKERLVTMRHLDDGGKYEDVIVDVPYDEITKVSFGSEYLALLLTYGQNYV